MFGFQGGTGYVSYTGIYILRVNRVRPNYLARKDNSGRGGWFCLTKLIELKSQELKTEVAQRATIDQIEMSLGAIFTHLLNRNTF